MSSVLDRDSLNAFCRHTHVEVAGTASGPLAGLTFGVKDIYDVAGVGTAFGNPDWLATHPVPTKTAPIVERLLAAGASVIGKTHTDEIAFSINGINAHYGRTTNPKAAGRLSGGSSSGSAAAVAGELCDFALGADTGGSVRLPASFNGLYGLRTTHGRISLEGARTLAPSFDTAGWFARDLSIFARVGKVLLTKGRSWPKFERVVIAEDAFALVDPGVKEALRAILDRMAQALGTPRPVTLASDSLQKWFEIFRTIQFSEIWRVHGEWIRRVNPKFGPGVAERVIATSKLDPGEISRAEATRIQIATRVTDLLGDRTLMILPTAPGIAPLVETSIEDLEDFRGRAMRLLCISSLTRVPQLNLPAASLHGCPLGISLIGPVGADEALIDAAQRIMR
ncbi:MAG: amidase [Sphingobium sp.]